MFCRKCGSEITEGDAFCIKCGTAVEKNDQPEVKTESVLVTDEKIKSESKPVHHHAPGHEHVGVHNIKPDVNHNQLHHHAPGHEQVGAHNVKPDLNHNQSYHHENSNSHSHSINHAGVPKSSAGLKNYNAGSSMNNGNNTILLGIGIAILAALILLIFVFITNGNDEKNVKEENGVVAQTTQTYNVEFNNIKFQIPVDLQYEKNENQLFIGNTEQWAFSLQMINKNFSTVDKNQILTNVRKDDKSAKLVEKNINKKKFLVYEYTLNSYRILMVYTAGPKDNIVFGGQLIDANNEFNYEAFDVVADVLSSAKYVTQTSNMDFNTEVDVFGKAGLK